MTSSLKQGETDYIITSGPDAQVHGLMEDLVPLRRAVASVFCFLMSKLQSLTYYGSFLFYSAVLSPHLKTIF